MQALDHLLQFNDEEAVVGSTVLTVRRIGKEVMFELERADHPDGNWLLGVHLRMTGRLIHHSTSSDRGEKHLRAVIDLDRGRVNFYDMRRFGTIRLYRSEDEAQPIGDEPLLRSFNGRRLAQLVRASNMPVKVWLLRQDRICGIGNIYASEILFDSGIDPFRPISALDQAELDALAISTKKILRKAIRHCGTTFSDFQNANGEVGGYQRYLKVYQHTGEDCPRCGNQIQRAVQAQRSTFWCPACQR